jgi:hypothetical protein
VTDVERRNKENGDRCRKEKHREWRQVWKEEERIKIYRERERERKRAETKRMDTDVERG